MHLTLYTLPWGSPAQGRLFERPREADTAVSSHTGGAKVGVWMGSLVSESAV